LTLSDVENGSILMLTLLTPVATQLGYSSSHTVPHNWVEKKTCKKHQAFKMTK